MEPIGLMPLATGVFAGVAAAICFRRAADPMAALARYKARYGIDYARNVSDPEKYAAHMSRISTFSGVFLSLVALVLLIAGIALLCSPSRAERQAEAARVRQAMDQSDREMRDYMQRQDAERMKHMWDVHPPATQSR